MKKTLIVLGSLMLLAAVAYPVFAHGPGWGGGRHMTGPGGYGCPGWGRGYGGPAGEDVAALGKLRQDFVEETRTLREEIRTKSNELDRLLATENPDEERVRSLHKDLSELRAKMADKRLEYRIRARKEAPEAGYAFRGRGFGGPGRGMGPGACWY
ncbi:MAG: periplasmic heavy metal sensor [Deltaproteobacteria bacterium]|nr:periplasmic heavy metal sensor [Deltaproteobacteria bacterium]MBW1924012.1 periplasmic heavy metal sensor [Deltaproteobacteria bacterium]MBW1949438.1 periplasmic heavy metal sensor [Deltaproteobacteria bacterium]MBW2348355.1 periplasmic heavy metal sensor [Deltaproteobacteria bacterium]